MSDAKAWALVALVGIWLADAQFSKFLEQPACEQLQHAYQHGLDNYGKNSYSRLGGKR